MERKRKESILEETNEGKRLLWEESEEESMIEGINILEIKMKLDLWWIGKWTRMYTRRQERSIAFDGKESEEENMIEERVY